MSKNKKDKAIVFTSKHKPLPDKCATCPLNDDGETISYYEDRIAYLENLVKKYKFDVLTGLMGKLDFYQTFDRVFEEYRFAQTQFTLVIADVDNLHNINKEFGMIEGGDRVLVEVAEALKENFALHQIYRISGDEFCLVIRDSVLDYDTITEKMKKIPHVSFIAQHSKDKNRYTNPKQLFNIADKKLVELKLTKKQEKRL